jgi:hypothetical protein
VGGVDDQLEQPARGDRVVGGGDEDGSLDGTEWVFDVTAMEQQIVDGAANWGYRFTISSHDGAAVQLVAGAGSPAGEGDGVVG